MVNSFYFDQKAGILLCYFAQVFHISVYTTLSLFSWAFFGQL